MPYIDPKRRPALNVGCIPATALSTPQTAGELNYSITRLIQKYLGSKPRVGYAEMNEVVGVLEAAKLEFYRRRVSPYEDEKIKQNGDVYEQETK